MKRRSIIPLAASIAALLLSAFLAWTFLEVQPRERYIPPSREARTNKYLALDRWLAALGHPVRTAKTGGLATVLQARERQVFVQASRFDWTSGSAERLTHWIEQGGTLFISIDYFSYFSEGERYSSEWKYYSSEWETELTLLLEKFGIEIFIIEDIETFLDENPNFMNRHYFSFSGNSPHFSELFYFEVEPGEGVTSVDDEDDVTRLVRVQRGGGALIVSSGANFLLSENLHGKEDAKLAWALFADTHNEAKNEGDRGWFFIRASGTEKTSGLVGSLFRHGNFAVFIIAALVFLAAGLWAAIPVFGLLRRDEPPPGKPLRERFVAEGRFLKRYGALELYYGAYVKEIKRQFARKENITANEEIISRVSDLLGEAAGGGRESQLFASAVREEPIPYRDFPKMITIFQTILERI